MTTSSSSQNKTTEISAVDAALHFMDCRPDNPMGAMSDAEFRTLRNAQEYTDESYIRIVARVLAAEVKLTRSALAEAATAMKCQAADIRNAEQAIIKRDHELADAEARATRLGEKLKKGYDFICKAAGTCGGIALSTCHPNPDEKLIALFEEGNDVASEIATELRVATPEESSGVREAETAGTEIPAGYDVRFVPERGNYDAYVGGILIHAFPTAKEAVAAIKWRLAIVNGLNAAPETVEIGDREAPQRPPA